MWSVLGEVLSQAIGIAISPIPVVLVILVLVSARARSNGLAFAAGWLLGVLLVVSAAYALSDTADVATDPEAADGGSAVQVLLGLVFVALAVRTWRQRPRPGVESPPPKLFGAMDSMAAIKVFALAFGAAAVNFKNLPLAISSGVTIASAGLSSAEGLTTLVIFGVVASLTIIVPVAAVLVLGERTRPPLDALKDWLLANNSTIMLVLFVVLAAKMLGSGLALAN
jgi:hypothetical protein